MCLIVVAHRASDRFPLVIAANRDEEYARPARAADFWESGDVVGGRDAVHGGSWLAMTRGGRFAAVTNLRGTIRPAEGRSRGELVADFVTGEDDPLLYARDVATRAALYGGFHLLVGEAGRDVVQLSGEAQTLPPGIHGISNAPSGVQWPKVATARDAMRGALESSSAAAIADGLLRIFHVAAGGDATRDHFVRGDRYGTRATTIIVVEGRRVLFVEQTYGRRGVVAAPRNDIEFGLEQDR